MEALKPPKRAQSSYMLWLAEARPAIMESLGAGGASITEVAKKAGKEWGKLDAKTKAPFEQEAKAGWAEYHEKLEAFKEKGGVITPRRAKGEKKVKDPNKPKRPATSYLLWMADNREKIANDLPADHTFTDVAVEAGRQWQALSAKKKEPYQKKALKLKDDYKKAVADYKP